MYETYCGATKMRATRGPSHLPLLLFPREMVGLILLCNAVSLESCRVSSNSRVMCIVLVNVASHSGQENSFSGFRVLGLG
jgi:hypothetical protein